MNDSLSSDQVFISRLTEIVVDHLTDEGFTVERLAQEAGMSRVNLYRRLKSIKNQDVSKFIREVRLQRAMEMLRNKEGTAAEIAFRVGFGSPAYFNKCFSEYYGYPPGKVNRRGSFKKKGKPSPAKHWKIAGYISFVVIVGLIVFTVLSRSDRSEELGVLAKPIIAVLPFINDSPSAENEHVINGYMASVHDNLCRIKTLKVLSLQSTEQYRDNPRPLPEIFRQLNVGYMLSARGQMYDNKIRLIVQLIDANENIIWSHPYDRLINDMGDHIGIQSEIAQLVAKELQARITPEEKQLIEKIPTPSLIAYDYYLRGQEERRKYSLGEYWGPLKRAESYYHKALEHDSTFAKAYLGLASVYFLKQFLDSDSFFSENFMDSVLILADVALSYDDQLAEAYAIRGRYYYRTGLFEKAEKEYDKAIRYNPNDGLAYYGKAELYANDLIQRIDNLQKAASLYGEPGSPNILRDLGAAYLDAGFPDKTNHLLQEALRLDGDSTKYYYGLAFTERSLGKYEKAIELGGKAYAINSNHYLNLKLLGGCYLYLGQNKESLKYFKIYVEKIKTTRSLIFGMDMIGYTYLQNGYKKEAEDYFNEQINYYNRMNELGRIVSTQKLLTYSGLARIYAFKGEKDKAYDNLKVFNQRKVMYTAMVTDLKYNPLFNSIRDEPEFQQIFREIEAKYEAEHERVRQWLEENDML